MPRPVTNTSYRPGGTGHTTVDSVGEAYVSCPPSPTVRVASKASCHSSTSSGGRAAPDLHPQCHGEVVLMGGQHDQCLAVGRDSVRRLRLGEQSRRVTEPWLPAGQ